MKSLIYILIISFLMIHFMEYAFSQDVPLNESPTINTESKKDSNYISIFGNKEERDKRRKERQENRKKRVEERKLKKQQKLAEKAIEKSKQKKIRQINKENLKASKEQLKKRKEELAISKKRYRSVEVVSNEEDPVYIFSAVVTPGKTEFLKIKGVDLEFETTIQNQTPKVVKSILILWERVIPFSQSQTIAQEKKITKPLLPYEKRTFVFNETNSKRDGEYYRVKVMQIVFEDGTQWKNSSTPQMQVQERL